MQTSPSARKLTLRAPRFDSTSGRRKGFWYSWRALAAGLALALLAGSGIAVAAVGSSAEAHTPNFTSTCAGFTVSGDYYNTSKGDINTIDAVIDGQPQPTVHFGSKASKSFVFTNPGVAHSYSAVITAWDDADATKGWTKTWSGKSVACPDPTVSISIPKCTVAGGTLDLTATLGQLDSSHAYTVALSSADAGGTNVPATALPGGFAAPNGSYVFKNVVPGHDYTATIVDTTTGLSATGVATSAGCPTDSGINVSATQCTVPGGSGDFSVTVSNLSFGRAYTVKVLDASNVVVASQPVVGDLTGTATIPFAVSAGGTYKATVTDDQVGAASTKTSDPKAYLPCPKLPDPPAVNAAQCTSTNGVSDASISFSASGLVPLRSYQVTVSNGTTNVYDSKSFVASASNWPTAAATQSLTKLGAGTYTVTVADVTDPKLTTFVSSDAKTLIPCPSLPNLAFNATQCTVPGGSASIVATVTNFIPGRAYLIGVSLVQGGTAVVAPVSIQAPLTGPWVLPAYANLAPGSQYRITVVDSVVPTVIASGDVSLNVCPGMPSITVQATCDVLGSSSVNVSLAKLEANQTYTVSVANASKKTVATSTVAATGATASLKLPNVPNGASYVVTVANANNTLTGSANIFLKVCDLTTLAFTGANPVGPVVAGIGFLQMGLVLVGLSLVFRRRRTA